ncbi:MAG: PBP1A family penicillin-binding protein [Hydrogenibacillus sp.]|nr:PBP1A family penicillin-binding protein [Hydrogenibacillus sp.]
MRLWRSLAGTVLAAMAALFLALCALFIFVYVNLGPLTGLESAGIDWRFRDGTPVTGPNEGRPYVRLSEISPALIDATLAVEDRRFYDHIGLDPKRIVGAFIKNVSAGRILEGASTITQQLARNLYLSHERTLWRKFQEAVLAVKLERELSKEEILERYLNTIYYGNGAYGVEAAARAYFGKAAKDLTLAEAALLAGIPKGPSLYEPRGHPNAAKARRRVVLQAMVDDGRIRAEDARRAAEEPIVLAEPHERPDLFGYARDEAARWIEATLGISRSAQPYARLKVTLTLDPEATAAAEKALRRRLPPDDPKLGPLSVSIVVLDPNDGGIRALVGGRDYAREPYNRAMARRPPGSTFKPIVYLTALEAGMTPLTVVDSKPTAFVYDDGRRTYTPHNYGDHYYGPITMIEAVRKSDNIYAVSALMAVGAEAVVKRAHELGVEAPLPAVPAVSLGAVAVTPLELATVYAALSSGGLRPTPHLVERVETIDGRVLYAAHPERVRVADEAHAFVLTRLLEEVFEPGGTAAGVAADIHRPVAGKSGTTPTDAWMAGYTPDLVTVVWVGRDDMQPIDDRIASPIAKHLFAEVLEEAHAGSPPRLFSIPDGVAAAYVDLARGEAACGKGELYYFIRGTEPKNPCTVAGGSANGEANAAARPNGAPPTAPETRRETPGSLNLPSLWSELMDRLRSDRGG